MENSKYYNNLFEEYFMEGRGKRKTNWMMPRRKTKTERRIKKRSKRFSHRGTNWKTSKTRKGYKRVKIGNRYVLSRMSPVEKKTRKRIGKRIGGKNFS